MILCKLFFVFLSSIIFLAAPVNTHAEQVISDLNLEGETIIYNIKKFGVTVGEATLKYNGPVEVDGQEVLAITFTAKGFQFYDEEQIFVDPQTFHPVLIKRNLDIFGQKQKINEFYDRTKGKVRIIRMENGKNTEEVIEKGGRFDNIYGFIYRQRLSRGFSPESDYQLHLPTRDVTIKFIKRVKFKAIGKVYDAFFMASVPKKYKIWFDSGPNKVPLRIIGAVGMADVSMIIKSRDQDQGNS